MKKRIKDNYCILIGLVIGALLSATVVYATGSFGSNNVYYKNNRSSLSSNNVQGAIDELASKIEEPTECPEGFSCVRRPQLGEYVSMTPTLTSATADMTVTGYIDNQVFNPSELNLWRVINKNSNGTVDVISEYTSSASIAFKGRTGYLNLVGYLNELAGKYENNTYTTGSRHFGYNGQTEYITDTSMFTATAPWTCSTGEDSCDTIESKGGGDSLYQNDSELVNNVLSTLVATSPNSTEANYYWIASRFYQYNSQGLYHWRGRNVNPTNTIRYSALYNYETPEFKGYDNANALRPIVTLKSGLKYSGEGTKDSPLELSVS